MPFSLRIVTGSSSLAALCLAACGTVLVPSSSSGSSSGGGSSNSASPATSASSGGSCDPLSAKLWSKAFGAYEEGNIVGIVAGGCGSTIVAGSLTGPEELDAGTALNLQFIASFDATGHEVWNKAFPDPIEFTGMGSAASGDLFLTGTTQSGADLGGGPLLPPGSNQSAMLLARFDASGHHVFSEPLGVTSQSSQDGIMPTAIAVRGSGDVVVAGWFMGAIDLGSGPLGPPSSPPAIDRKPFIAQFDPSGHHLWSRRLGTNESAQAKLELDAIAVGHDGSIVLAGSIQGAVDLDGSTPTTFGEKDAFVGKLDDHGHVVFAEVFGGPGNDFAASVALGSDGSIFFTGSATGTVDFGTGPLPSTNPQGAPFLAALAPDGAVRWSRRFPEAEATGASGVGIAIDPAGDVLVHLGRFDGTIAIVARLEPEMGGLLHSHTFTADALPSGQARLASRAFAVDPAGNAVLGGWFQGTLDFGEGPLQGDDSGSSPFVAKVAP